ncbi:MAG: LysR family transcriptional regulator [Deltaproteobacteria bacterium]|nr:LysR family transcriptional regulator [Deltaproteobacteria bacterium]
MSELALTNHLEKLRYFVEIATSGSFGKAARSLRIAQPTLSHAMKILEDALSADLLVRTSRGIQLTAAGRRLLEFSERLFRDTSAFHHALSQEKADVWRCTVGTKEPYAVGLWPGYLRTIREKAAPIEISLSIERSNQGILEKLVRQNIDAALIPDPPENEFIHAYEVITERFCLFRAPKAPHAPLFVFGSSFCGANRRVREVLSDLSRPTERIVDVDSFPAAKAMALAGLGTALLPHFFSQAETAAGLLEEVTAVDTPSSAFGTVKICLCVHKKDAKNPRVRSLVRLLRAAE